VYRPVSSNDVILGAVGSLQFDVVQYRLKDEYGVECVFEPVQVHCARWVDSEDPRLLREFRDKHEARLALDHQGALVYLASSNVNLSMAAERHPGVRFTDTREQNFSS
jgi:peptide chain release factor 3